MCATHRTVANAEDWNEGLLVCLTAVCLVLTGCTANNANNTNTGASSATRSKPSATNAAAAAKAAMATKAPAAPLAAGQSAKIGDIEVTLTGSHIIPPTDVDQPKPGNQYVDTSWKVVNTTAKPYDRSTLLQVSLLDKDSHKYTESLVSQGTTGSIDGTLPANGTVAGDVVFEAPIAEAPYRARFAQPFGSTTDDWAIAP